MPGHNINIQEITKIKDNKVHLSKYMIIIYNRFTIIHPVI